MYKIYYDKWIISNNNCITGYKLIIFHLFTFITISETDLIGTSSWFFLDTMLVSLSLNVLDNVGSLMDLSRIWWEVNDCSFLGTPKSLSLWRWTLFSLKYIQEFNEHISTVGNKRSTNWIRKLNTIQNTSSVTLEFVWPKHVSLLAKLGFLIKWFLISSHGRIWYL